MVNERLLSVVGLEEKKALFTGEIWLKLNFLKLLQIHVLSILFSVGLRIGNLFCDVVSPASRSTICEPPRQYNLTSDLEGANLFE